MYMRNVRPELQGACRKSFADEQRYTAFPQQFSARSLHRAPDRRQKTPAVQMLNKKLHGLRRPAEVKRGDDMQHPDQLPDIVHQLMPSNSK
jgi:hypothetical protein